MTHSIAILDYGAANLLNVARALEYVGANVKIVDDACEISSSERLVVPGVGAFAHAMEQIRKLGFDDAIRAFIDCGRPFLGICVGMQILFDESEEFGNHSGLGIVPGRISAVPAVSAAGASQRVPHIGWNHLETPISGRSWTNTLLHETSVTNPALYFVHSFAAQPSCPDDELADCIYGGHRLCAAIQRDNVVATQFHPERSGHAGLRILEEFLKW